MKPWALIAICILGLYSSGCGRRQSAARIVFVNSIPAPVSTASDEASGALVVAEPQQPSPDDEPGPPVPEPAGKPATRPRVRLAPPDPETEAEPSPAPPAEVPALEPREGPAVQAAQRQQVLQLLDQIRTRAARQDKMNLSPSERRMVGDARTFLTQSERAIAASDFQRALTLARKASMLLAVMEQQ